jgi:hypothetical protein
LALLDAFRVQFDRRVGSFQPVQIAIRSHSVTKKQKTGDCTYNKNPATLFENGEPDEQPSAQIQNKNKGHRQQELTDKLFEIKSHSNLPNNQFVTDLTNFLLVVFGS